MRDNPGYDAGDFKIDLYFSNVGREAGVYFGVYFAWVFCGGGEGEIMMKRKTQSAKRKVKTRNSKLLVLSFSFALFALHFSLITSFVFAQSISSAELINNAKQYDGQTVTYEGELIGDVMLRGNYAWLNLNDGENALGIWAPKSFTNIINYTGGYKAKGDWLRVNGEFHRACPEHGGDLDIHAKNVEKINAGRATNERVNTSKIYVVLIWLGILVVVWILRQLKLK